MTKILICEKIAPVCSEMFREAGFEVTEAPGLSHDELAEQIGEYDGLVVRSATRVTADIIARADSLKIIGRAGAGVDTIDVAAAASRGIKVVNTPGQNAGAVAELVFGLMFALIRHIPRASASLQAGRWEKDALKGTEISGKTIGVVGYGAIGRRVGAMAAALGMTVLAHDPFLADAQIQEAGAAPRALAEICSVADFITLHLPKTRESEGLIGAEILALMKPTACLINCARGGLVDEAALARALESGRLRGAAMDVFAQEPPSADNPLLRLPNFIGTPHIGASTCESQVNVAAAVARQMIQGFGRA